MPESIYCGDRAAHGPHDGCIGWYADPDLIQPADRSEGVINALLGVCLVLVVLAVLL